MAPELKTTVDADAAATLLKLIDVLDDDDDVQTVWGNYEIPDEVMATLG
jgi:transcriptional/translational regulatory protein YebC/TACO1